MTGPRHGYAWTVFGFTTGIILGDGLSGSTPIENLAFDRATLVGLGILAALTAGAVFWPVRPEQQLRGGLGLGLASAADATDRARERLAGSTSPANSGGDSAPSALIDRLGLIDQLPSQLGVSPTDVREFTRLAIDLEGFTTALRALASEPPDGAALPERLREPLDELLRRASVVLRESANALTEARSPAPHGDSLLQAMTQFDETRIAHLGGVIAAAGDESPAMTADPVRSAEYASRLARSLRRIVDLLVQIELALVRLAGGGVDPRLDAAPQAAATKPSFSIDPLRRELGLRAFIAVASVFVVMPLLGWEVNSMVMTLVFMVAALPTRASMVSTAVGLLVAALSAWLIADLSIVYIVPHMGRMPIALLYPLLLAGVAGYAMVRFPKLAPIAPTIAMIPILSVFGGVRPPTNVQGPYETTVIIFTGIAIGVVAQRMLWPRTAAELFLMRAIGALELCRRLLRLEHAASLGDRAVEGRAVAEILAEAAQEAALLTQMHTQAQLEPVHRALDGDRRARLMSGVEELFQACFGLAADRGRSDDASALAEQPTVAPLAAALSDQDEAVTQSLDEMLHALRQGTAPAFGRLTEAQANVEAELAALRGMAGLAAALGGRGVDTLSSFVDERGRTAARMAALERWLDEWSRERRQS